MAHIVARIQAHPSRSHLHGSLVGSLDLPTEIFLHESDPPNPWEGYKRCLSGLPEASHILIVQDDAQPCMNFAPALEQIAERHPTIPVCLFMGSQPGSAATKARRVMIRGVIRYIPLGPASFVPLVAVLWPKEKAKEFLRWSRSGHTTRADDGNAARWMKTTKQQIMVTVPSLVEHDDFQPSVKGGREHIPWTESWRRALFLASDGLDYQW